MERDEALGCADGIERPLQVVAEVDDLRDRPQGDIGEHGLERQQVAVNVRDGGKASSSGLASAKGIRPGAGCRLLQALHLCKDLRCFGFEGGALSDVILFRILAGAVFEVQVAQVVVEDGFLLFKEVEPCFHALCGDLCAPGRRHRRRARW